MTLNTPKVSVFMPVYNHADFLVESIESVLQQDYPNLQLCIGDDASKDNSAEIIKDYAARYPDKIVYYINEKNLGVTDNCNKLLTLCDGEYVAFGSGDDIFLPGKIAQQVRFMQENPNCVVSYTNAKIFGAGIEDTLYYSPFPGRQPYETRNGDITAFMKHRNFIVGCTVMARTDFFPVGYYNKEIRIMSDWLFFVEVASKGDVLYIDQVLSGYRRHGNSLTTRYTDIADFEKTYALASVKFPAYQDAINLGLARLYASYTSYYLLKGDLGQARTTAVKLFKLIKTNWKVLLFVLETFASDCIRYAYRLVKQGWSL